MSASASSRRFAPFDAERLSLFRSTLYATVRRFAPQGSRRRHLLVSVRGWFRQSRFRTLYPRHSFTGPIKFREAPAPEASVIICVYNQLEWTRRCLGSLVSTLNRTSFEVIIVDDCSEQKTVDYLSTIDGALLIRNDQNLGFLRSANIGAQAARAPKLLFLNSDTVVTDGAIDELILALDTPTTVVAGAKLLYPSGAVQEAGGVIWTDGTGMNFGRADHNPSRAEYSYWREVDYVSGAAMAVQRDYFDRSGGFDSAFAPAYFEDTDLCFRARRDGYKVMFVSTAVVYHLEGVSHGASAATASHQLMERNRPIFREKWHDELQLHFLNDEQSRGRAARRLSDQKGRITVIDFFPRWLHESGGVRLFEMLKTLRSFGWSVLFISLNDCDEQMYRRDLARHGITVVPARPREWSDNIWQIVQSSVAVIAARPEGMSFFEDHLRLVLPDVPLAYDTVDLHFLREYRERFAEAITPTFPSSQAVIDSEELAWAKSATLTLVTSQTEESLLRQIEPSIKTLLLSNVHVPREVEPPLWSERAGLAFVANFNHIPNADGLRWFLDEVFPLVLEEEPTMQLRIAGSPTPLWLQNRVDANTDVLGWVSDLTSLYDSARIAVAPLRFGAGVKGKVGEAWSLGVPTVLTSIASEGMQAISGHNCIVADTPQSFADSLLELHSNRLVWERIQKQAVETVGNHFGLQVFHRGLEEALSALLPTGHLG